MEQTPKDAAAVILTKGNRVLLAQRNPKLSFLGGWHAFPGGKLDASDREIEVKNCGDAELNQFIVCAARELFEEAGVLLVRNGDKLTKGQRASLHDDLISGRSTFAEILADWGLWLDADDFQYTGFWTTPNFSPVRFKTRFFIAECPDKQEPYPAITELQNLEFIEPQSALHLWEKGKILISPPVLVSLKELADFCRKKTDGLPSSQIGLCVENLFLASQKCGGKIDYLEANTQTIVFPLKTPTLPPATHTNCFIVGKKEFVVIDAASADESEQRKLHDLIDEMAQAGGICREIIVSHLHRDHHGGEISLQKYLREKHGWEVSLAAHHLTAEKLPHITFKRFIEDNETFKLKDKNGDSFTMQALHTPGHARGLLAFYLQETGFLLSTDNVIAAGTVVIAPPEGVMKDYLHSLDRLRNLPKLHFLCGSHGTAIYDARGKIEEYLSHRRHREKQILDLMEKGIEDPAEIVEKLYTGLDKKLVPLALKTVEAHLIKISEFGN